MIKTVLLLSVVVAVLGVDTAPQPQEQSFREIAGLRSRVARQSDMGPLTQWTDTAKTAAMAAGGAMMDAAQMGAEMATKGMQDAASMMSGAMRSRRAARMKSVGQAPSQPPQGPPGSPQGPPEPPQGPPPPPPQGR